MKPSPSRWEGPTAMLTGWPESSGSPYSPFAGIAEILPAGAHRDAVCEISVHGTGDGRVGILWTQDPRAQERDTRKEPTAGCRERSPILSGFSQRNRFIHPSPQRPPGNRRSRVVNYRYQLERYIYDHPDFLQALNPFPFTRMLPRLSER